LCVSTASPIRLLMLAVVAYSMSQTLQQLLLSTLGCHKLATDSSEMAQISAGSLIGSSYCDSILMLVGSSVNTKLIL
jgi:hypothetical protein